MESGIGDTAESTQPAPRSRLHLTQPEQRGGEKEATTTQTLPVEASLTGRNIKDEVARPRALLETDRPLSAVIREQKLCPKAGE